MTSVPPAANHPYPPETVTDVKLTRCEISLLIRGLRSVEQQTRGYKAENEEVAALRKRLTGFFMRTVLG
jgi:hypothetical protein